MAKAKDIVCPVEACKAAPGRQCKLVDLQNNPFLGKYHLKRIQTAEKAPNQNASEVLGATNRVVNFYPNNTRR